MQEGNWPDPIAMALERLEAGAAAGILDLDCLIVWPWYNLYAVMQKGNWPDPTAIALERLKASAAASILDLDYVIVWPWYN
jgi:hypothetical protein